MKMLKITQVKSEIGSIGAHRETVRSLGLRRIGQTVYRSDNPQVRGMVAHVAHLVSCEVVDREPEQKKGRTAGYHVVKSKKA